MFSAVLLFAGCPPALRKIVFGALGKIPIFDALGKTPIFDALEKTPIFDAPGKTSILSVEKIEKRR